MICQMNESVCPHPWCLFVSAALWWWRNSPLRSLRPSQSSPPRCDTCWGRRWLRGSLWCWRLRSLTSCRPGTRAPSPGESQRADRPPHTARDDLTHPVSTCLIRKYFLRDSQRYFIIETILSGLQILNRQTKVTLIVFSFNPWCRTFNPTCFIRSFPIISSLSLRTSDSPSS